jgi:phage shock protein A
MSIGTDIAKQVVHDKIDSQVKTVQAKLETLRAKAQTAKANTELKMIAELLAKKQTIDQKISELKKSSEGSYQQARTDVESHIAELEKSVQAIEAKFKAA